MICENTEKFYMSKILIERQAIQDSEGKEIFFIDSFESENELACDISLNTPSINSTNGTENGDDQTDKTRNKAYFRRKNNIGLSGGAIAGLVVSIVVAILATSIVILLGKKSYSVKIAWLMQRNLGLQHLEL